MNSRRIRLGLGAALSFASFYSSFSATALAQDPVPPASAPNPEPAPTPEPAADAKPADAPAGTTAIEPVKEQEKVAEEVKPPDALPPPTVTTASGTSVEREKSVSLVGVELLPASAYPATYTRGIKYGSMWLTFHGQQWPYMPLIEGGPGLRVGISGSLWNDLSYAKFDADPAAGNNIQDRNRWTTQSRGVLRVTPTYNAKGGWFAQGNAEFVAHGDMQPDVISGNLGTNDDLWVRFGKWNVFDIQVGRFQGWEIANHFGMGLDLNTLERAGAFHPSGTRPTDGYGLSYFWDRQEYLLGGYAAHFYPTKYLRAEILGHFGAGSATTSPYQIDVRPAAIFDIGWVKLKAGLEYGKATPQDPKQQNRVTRSGYGFAAQFVVNPWVEFGGSYARGFNDDLDDKGLPALEKSNTVSTFGGFVNASPGYEPVVLGFGAFRNTQDDLRPDNSRGGKVDTNNQTQIFGAAQYTLWNQLYLKMVVSHASNDVEHYRGGIYTNKSLSARFRVMLLF